MAVGRKTAWGVGDEGRGGSPAGPGPHEAISNVSPRIARRMGPLYSRLDEPGGLFVVSYLDVDSSAPIMVALE